MEPAFGTVPSKSLATPWLARFVEDVQLVEPAPGRAHAVQSLPDGRTNLVLRVLAGEAAGDLTISGPRTRAHFKSATGLTRAVIVRFKPGWSAPLLGVAAHAVTDRFVHLTEIWGRPGDDLCRELLTLRSVPEIVERLSSAIARHTENTPEPTSARLARRAARLLEAEGARVEQVASELGVSARHLRRAFTEHVGIGPKDFARTVRLQRAVRLAATSRDWGRIAATAGYYDQAHLIADFQELIGLTPGAYVKHTVERMAPSCAQ